MKDGMLFDIKVNPFGSTEHLPRARNSDPEQSHEGAMKARFNFTEKRKWVYNCISATPGLTSNELAEIHCPGIERKIGRRLRECTRLGLLREGPVRTCRVTGNRAFTWFACRLDDYI